MTCTIILKTGIQFTCGTPYVDDQGYLAYPRMKQRNALQKLYDRALKREPVMEDVYFNPDDIMVSIFDREEDAEDDESMELELIECIEGEDESLSLYV